jgi:DNA-directed RNA polymerase beta subunit
LIKNHGYLDFFLIIFWLYIPAPGASVTGEDVLIGKVVEINKTAETHKQFKDVSLGCRRSEIGYVD